MAYGRRYFFHEVASADLTHCLSKSLPFYIACPLLERIEEEEGRRVLVSGDKLVRIREYRVGDAIYGITE